jgi:sodium ion-translocating decarboxylase beta subunit
MTALGELIESPLTIVMILLALFVIYLGIEKRFEPLLLVPIGFGILLANFPGGNMNVVSSEMVEDIDQMNILLIAKEHGIMNMLYYALIKTGLLPPLIFMGVGAMTDFGPMLRNLRLAFFGAAAQIGIFTVLIAAVFIGFPIKEAGALGIIGGADGPTAIYTSIILAPRLLGPIAIAAYSYMALVPVIIPFVVKYTTNKNELMINMREQDKLHPSKTKINDLRTAKIIFPGYPGHHRCSAGAFRYAPGRHAAIRQSGQGNRLGYQPPLQGCFRDHHEHRHHLPRPDRRRHHDSQYFSGI